MSVINKEWYNYIIFDKVKTYVGSTVNLDRRIRQHNGVIKGGAKYTKGGKWQYYCVIYNLNNQKNICLSEEWHIKWMSNKVNNSKNTFDRRRKAIEKYYKTRPLHTEPYSYIIFVSKFYHQYLPKLDNKIFVMIIDDFKMSTIKSYIKSLNLIVKLNKHFIN